MEDEAKEMRNWVINVCLSWKCDLIHLIPLPSISQTGVCEQLLQVHENVGEKKKGQNKLNS